MVAPSLNFQSSSSGGLLSDLRSAVNRLEVGEFTLILQANTVIRIERQGRVCVYCEIPIAVTCPEAASA